MAIFNQKKLIYMYVALAITGFSYMLPLGSIAPRIPSFLQNDIASKAIGETVKCETFTPQTMPDYCVEASSTAATYNAYIKFVVSIVGMFLNPLIGYLSDILGRKYILILMVTFPVLSMVSLILYIYEVSWCLWVFLILFSLTPMLDIQVIINSIVVDVTDVTKRSKIMSINATINTFSVILGPFLSLIPPQYTCYSLIGIACIVCGLLFFLPSNSDLKESSLSLSRMSMTTIIKPESFIEVFKKYFKKNHYVYTVLGLAMFFGAFGFGIQIGSVLYYLQATINMTDTQRSIYMLLLGLSGVLTNALFFPLSRKYMSISTFLSIALFLNLPLIAVKFFVKDIIIIYVVEFFLEGMTLAFILASGVYIGENVIPIHQGSIQGYVTSYRIFGNGIGTLFVGVFYKMCMSAGGIYQYVPCMAATVGYIIAVIFALLFRKIHILVDKEHCERDPLLDVTPIETIENPAIHEEVYIPKKLSESPYDEDVITSF